jgi:hypothetical protein
VEKAVGHGNYAGAGLFDKWRKPGVYVIVFPCGASDLQMRKALAGCQVHTCVRRVAQESSSHRHVACKPRESPNGISSKDRKGLPTPGAAQRDLVLGEIGCVTATLAR